MRSYALIIAVIVPCLALADDRPAYEGKWKITSTMTMAGKEMPAETHTQCISKENPVPLHGSQHADNCKVIERTFTGGKFNWKLHCESKHGPIESEGHVTYTGGTFEGTTSVKAPDPRSGGTMDISGTVKGKRLGECDAK
jgi:hypothetical protein